MFHPCLYECDDLIFCFLGFLGFLAFFLGNRGALKKHLAKTEGQSSHEPPKKRQRKNKAEEESEVANTETQTQPDPTQHISRQVSATTAEAAQTLSAIKSDPA